ncbi:MAG: alpha/beta fold hydrolase [Clostridia bacterium]|nr:alpha/beta fold hydrolase [Clostridia bacterium]
MQDFSLPQAQPFDFPEGEHGVLLIHGFTGSPSHMRLIGEGLRENGFAVRGILLPGHGESPEAMARASWQDWFQAAREAAAEMRAKYRFFSVAGLSMGGCLALMLAEQMDADACAAIAAPMKTMSRFRSLASVAALVHPIVHKQADGSRKSLIADYDIGYDSYPLSSVAHLSTIMHRARRDLSLIRCPVLVIQSHGDKTVTPDSPDIILNGVSSGNKAQLWLDDAPHVCTISPEYPKIVSAITEFLRKAESE